MLVESGEIWAGSSVAEQGTFNPRVEGGFPLSLATCQPARVARTSDAPLSLWAMRLVHLLAWGAPRDVRALPFAACLHRPGSNAQAGSNRACGFVSVVHPVAGCLSRVPDRRFASTPSPDAQPEGAGPMPLGRMVAPRVPSLCVPVHARLRCMLCVYFRSVHGCVHFATALYHAAAEFRPCPRHHSTAARG